MSTLTDIITTPLQKRLTFFDAKELSIPGLHEKSDFLIINFFTDIFQLLMCEIHWRKEGKWWSGNNVYFSGRIAVSIYVVRQNFRHTRVIIFFFLLKQSSINNNN